MCNICAYPVKGNHLNWAECTGAWRSRAARQELVIAEQKARLETLDRAIAVARAALDDLGADLACKKYDTCAYDLDRAVRALDGRS